MNNTQLIIILPNQPEATRLLFFLRQLVEWKTNNSKELEKDVDELPEEDKVRLVQSLTIIIKLIIKLIIISPIGIIFTSY